MNGANQTVGITTGGPRSITAASTFQAVYAALPAGHLSFSVNPGASYGAGVTITPSPVVLVQDTLGNTITSFQGLVILSLQNANGATLAGTLTERRGQWRGDLQRAQHRQGRDRLHFAGQLRHNYGCNEHPL